MFTSLLILPLILPAPVAGEAGSVVEWSGAHAASPAGPGAKQKPRSAAPKARSTGRPQAAGKGGDEPLNELQRIKRRIKLRRRPITDRSKFFAANPVQVSGASDRGRQNADTTDERSFRMEFADEAQKSEWYALADGNANGWLSFRECEQALSFDRPRFRVYDADNDGRLAREEFEDYYLDSVRSNAFSPPSPPASPDAPPRRSPLQIRNAYDHDVDARLSANEVAAVLSEYDRAALPLDRVMAALDEDADGLLTVDELGGLPSLLFPVALPPADARSRTEDRPETILDLFGKVEPRGDARPGSLSPPYILGPVPHFRRLDLDNDGKISVRDLESLLRPVHVSIRIPTLINTLDTNLDGVLTETEFMAALGDSSSSRAD